MPAKLLCSGSYQLPPVPATAPLLAPTKGQTYEHQQGRKLLADMEYVVDLCVDQSGGQHAAWDLRLQEARGWYECAYEWRIVSCAMHANARLWHGV